MEKLRYKYRGYNKWSEWVVEWVDSRALSEYLLQRKHIIHVAC